MQTVAVFATLLASAAASPLMARNSCDAAPAGTDTSIKPISSPSATTADLCLQACLANPSCKAFLFGLPPNVKVPLCELYSVPAAQIPPAETNLHAFDSGCTSVPNVAPTTDHPQGTRDDSADTQPSTGQTGSQQQTQPTEGQQTGSQQQHKRENQCGATPAGPAGSPTPLQTTTAPGSLEACLDLCKNTAGCQAVEYGSPTPGAPAQCILFTVPVAQLPPPASGASIVASDVNC